MAMQPFPTEKEQKISKSGKTRDLSRWPCWTGERANDASENSFRSRRMEMCICCIGTSSPRTEWPADSRCSNWIP